MPRSHSLILLHGGTSATTAAWSWSPGISRRDFAVKTTGSPTFLGNPEVSLPCSLTPAGPLASGPLQCSGAVERGNQGEDPSIWNFRGSITRLRHLLRAPCEAWSASRCWLPRPHARLASAAGQALPEGLATLWVPSKGFRFCNSFTSTSSFPKFRGARFLFSVALSLARTLQE